MTTLDMMGWDVAYATTFARVNQGLHDSGKLPQSFQGTESTSKGSTSGQWASWNIVTGSPSNLLWVQCTVASGSLQIPNPNRTYDLSGSSWTVQFGLNLVKGGTTSGGGTTWSLAPASSGNGAPTIVASTVRGVSGTDIYILQAIMDPLLQGQVLALGTSFMSIILNDTSLAPDQPWLVPTTAACASESLPSGDPRVGIFALLAMTAGDSATGKQVVIDRRVLDGAPAGTNAAFAIGPGLILTQLLTPAMQSLVQGSSLSDFTNNGTTVYNKAPMTWGAFDWESDGTTATVSPSIPSGNIELSLDGEIVHLSMANVSFPYPGWKGPGQITIAFNTEQFITFDFVLRNDGGLVMVPQTGKFSSSCHTTIIPDKAVLEFEIALEVVLDVLLSVLGGVVESASEAVTEVATDALEEGTSGGYEADLDVGDLDDLVTKNVDEEEIQNIEQESAAQAGDALTNEGNEGYVQKFKNSIIANKWKLFMSIIEKAVPIAAGKVAEIVVSVAEKQYDELPSLELFADAGVKPVAWADSSFKLTGGSLQGALVLWGKLGS